MTEHTQLSDMSIIDSYPDNLVDRWLRLSTYLDGLSYIGQRKMAVLLENEALYLDKREKFVSHTDTVKSTLLNFIVDLYKPYVDLETFQVMGLPAWLDRDGNTMVASTFRVVSAFEADEATLETPISKETTNKFATELSEIFDSHTVYVYIPLMILPIMVIPTTTRNYRACMFRASLIKTATIEAL